MRLYRIERQHVKNKKPWIRCYEATNVTEKTAVIDGRRTALRSEWKTYYRTYEEARNVLRAYMKRVLSGAKYDIKLAEWVLGQINNWKEPEPEGSG